MPARLLASYFSYRFQLGIYPFSCGQGEKKGGEEWTKERRGRELHRLIPAPRKETVKLHIGLSKELSSLIGKIGLREFIFHRKVPGTEDGGCKYSQGNQPVKHILLECRLLARQRRNLWREEAKRARKGGRSLDNT